MQNRGAGAGNVAPPMTPQYQQQQWMMRSSPQQQPYQGWIQQLPSQQAQTQLQQYPTGVGGSNKIKWVWIGHLQPWMDENYLYNCFAHTGQAVSTKVIRNSLTGQPEVYGFIEFASHTAAEFILQTYNGTRVLGCGQKFRMNWATLGTDKKLVDNKPKYSLFVGDLAPEVTAYVLQETFRTHYQSVKGAEVVMDIISNRYEGYGFVTFGDEVELLCTMREMNGRLRSTRPMLLARGFAKNKPMGIQRLQIAAYPSAEANSGKSDPNSTTINKSKMILNWAEMNSDMLTVIASHMCLIQDYVAFRGVCRSWRNIATKELFSKNSSNQPPVLMLPEDDDNILRGTRDLYCLATKKVIRVLLPEASNKWCFETLGWLVIVSLDEEMELRHPFTKVRVALPSGSLFEHPEEDCYYLIHKAVLSASPLTFNYVLVVICAPERRLAFWRSGNRTWTYLETTVEQHFHDIVLYRDQFYAIDAYGSVYVIDFNSDGSSGVVKLCAQRSCVYRPFKSNLVVSKGELLIVYWRIVDFSLANLGLYKLDISRSILKKKKDLGDRALFLGHNVSSSVDSCKWPTIKPNCIYYTHPVKGNKIVVSYGIYSLADRKFEEFSIDQRRCFMFPPIFVTPSF